MSQTTPRTASNDLSDLKPGSRVEDAKAVGGKGDFGAHADDVVGRTYVSKTTKESDLNPNELPSRERTQGRTSGVQGNASGPGSSSGDIDAGTVNVGDSGLADDIPVKGARDRRDDRLPHADDTDGTSLEFASGGQAKKENQTGVGQIGGAKLLKPGAVALAPDARTTEGLGADAVSHAEDEIDDSFRGEISSSEASGADDAGR